MSFLTFQSSQSEKQIPLVINILLTVHVLHLTLHPLQVILHADLFWSDISFVCWDLSYPFILL